MEFQRSNNFDDGQGIPEDLRCKRSDGKQWRCSALSMPDKTVCEKHYIQAKKRAANSAMRASLKKARRKSLDDADMYSDTKDDDIDLPFGTSRGAEFSSPAPSKKQASKSQHFYSPDDIDVNCLGSYNSEKLVNDFQGDGAYDDENRPKSTHRTLTSGINYAQRSSNGVALGDLSSRSSESSEGPGGRICHQCRIKDRDTLVWCLRCNRKGYCDVCISKWYPDIPREEIQKACPACCGACNCKSCFRPDSLIKSRIREIAPGTKLQYLHCLLSLVLPVLQDVHREQSSELDLETKLNGPKTDLPRARLNPDEQMCCDCCKVPIIDYHRHCSNCLYDLCLTCCHDLRHASLPGIGVDGGENFCNEIHQDESCHIDLRKSPKTLTQSSLVNLSHISPDWKANTDGSIPCPPKESGGCGSRSLALRRIYKMNWVAKLVKNAEEMVDGCKVNDPKWLKPCISCLGISSCESSELIDSNLIEAAHRNESHDNFLYCPTPEDIRSNDLGHFQKHWHNGEPIIVKRMADFESSKSWEPGVLWSGIQYATEDDMKDDGTILKVIDCFDWSEVDVEARQFIKKFSEVRFHQDGLPELLILKEWPSTNALEDFLYYQRPDFISRLPLLEYIHWKWGFLNLAAKLPHDSLQPDVAVKLFMAYGTPEELHRGNSVLHLHSSMTDVVYLLMHSAEVKHQGIRHSRNEELHESDGTTAKRSFFGDKKKLGLSEVDLDSHGTLADLASLKHGENVGLRLELNDERDEMMEDNTYSESAITSEEEKGMNEVIIDNCTERAGSSKSNSGIIWDVFRRQDVTKLNEYLKSHWREFDFSPKQSADSLECSPVFERCIFLNKAHLRRLKEEFDIEPWTFEQCVHEAVYIPAGCSFQARYLQPSVSLAFDFLTPESLGDSIRLARDIRCLPNDHEAKLQMLEVGKMSLYAASSAIREIQRLTLDAKVSSEIGIEDKNLTALVSENIEKIGRRNSIPCV